MASELVFASTSIGLEDALAEELAAFGEVVERVRGGVLLRGELGLHQELCLRSRIANHVLLRLGTALGAELPALARAMAALPIDRVVRHEQAIEAVSSGTHPRVKDAVRLAQQAWGDRRKTPSAELRLRLTHEGCEVNADASGDILHKRGYRQEISRAPLRETIAAAMLRLAGYRGDEALWDPMCGSGTLAIEAAWMALGRAPGVDRSFAFMQWPSFDRTAWEQRVSRARAEERSGAPPIVATDLNAGSVGVARRNARRAGVLGHLRLERADATAAPPPAERGLLVANLPYGKRVEAGDELLGDFGKAIGRMRGWRFALLVHERAPIAQLGLPVDRRVQLDNGGIPCALLLGSIAS